MFLSRYVKEVSFFNGRGIFSDKNGMQKGKGLDLGAEPPRIKLC